MPYGLFTESEIKNLVTLVGCLIAMLLALTAFAVGRLTVRQDEPNRAVVAPLLKTTKVACELKPDGSVVVTHTHKSGGTVQYQIPAPLEVVER